MENNKAREIDLKLIVPDENQPRKLFEPTKMKNLEDSVKKYGVMTPITVEKVGDKYLIIDGERRFRVATKLGLKKIQATVIAPQSAIDRLVQQFHIQEQREEWTPVEKALTVYRLSSELGVSLSQICQLLSLDARTGSRYVAFSNIIDKEKYHKSEIGITWAEPITHLKNFAKKLVVGVLEEDFTRSDEKELESALIVRIKGGEFARASQLTKLKDIFSHNPKLIKSFGDSKQTVDSMFVTSKAKSSYYLRNLVNNCMYAKNHAVAYLDKMDSKPSKDQFSAIKNTIESLKKVVNAVGDVME